MQDEAFIIAGIGELLWDVFPTHKRLGGAPTNFAWHAHQLGATAYPITCVGNDDLGNELQETLEQLGINTQFVFQTNEFATGTVQVSLDKNGKPSYDILENVAWDHIPWTEKLGTFVEELDAVCFGSLCQRSQQSHESILKLLEQLDDSVLKIFDINIRQSFYSKAVIESSLKAANVLKLSDEELPILSDFFHVQGNTITQLELIRDQFDLDIIAYTRGPEGSFLTNEDMADDFEGCEGPVSNSVGAGDSFTAGLCMGLLHRWPLHRVNRFANQVATFVCSQEGATPELPEKFREELSML